MFIDFRGASAESVGALTQELTASGRASTAVAQSLFSVAQLLREDAALRRVLADPTLPPTAKQGFAGDLLGAKIDADSLAVLTSAAGRRWTSAGDLPAAIERLGEVAAIDSADDHRALVDELFELGRLVSGTPQLRDALSDPQRSRADRVGLFETILDDHVSVQAKVLAAQSLVGSYGTVEEALASYRDLAAELNGESVATVCVAHVLDPEQTGRLGAALARIYGRPVHLNTVLDPAVLGGVKVEIGDDVIDGTIATRLQDASRRLAG